MASEPVATRSPEHGDAARWLQQARGRAFRNRKDPDGPQGWVAVVAIPASPGRAAQMIFGMGPSLVEATRAVRREWDRHWQQIAPHHD